MSFVMARSSRFLASSPLAGQDNVEIALSDLHVRWGELSRNDCGCLYPPPRPSPARGEEGGKIARVERTLSFAEPGPA